MRALLACLLLPVAFDLCSDLSRELEKASPAEQAEILAGLPARMKDLPDGERRALAGMLVPILEDEGRAHLHVPALAPLLATGTGTGTETVLRKAYATEETVLREAARAALAADRTSEVTAHLASALRRDRSPRARAWLALFLGERGRASIGESETLLHALSDESFLVRGAAAEALTRIWGRAAGFDPEQWRAVLRAGPPPEEAVVPEAGKPGDTVTQVPPPPAPESLLAKLSPRYYGIPLDRAVVVAVVDFSGSVRGPKGRRAREELVRKLSLLPTTRAFTVLAFDQRLLRLFNAAERADPDRKTALEEFLRKLPPGQRTEMLLPLHVGMGMAREHAAAGAQVLVVSDGWQTNAAPPVRLVEAAAELAEAGVRIDVAVLGGAEVGLFRHLTRVTGGMYVPVR